MKKVTTLAIQQAELIIRLFELRREPVMRLARTYVGGEFLPRLHRRSRGRHGRPRTQRLRFAGIRILGHGCGYGISGRTRRDFRLCVLQ